jgi:hypothetical protein
MNENDERRGTSSVPPLTRWAIAALVCAGLSFSFLPIVGTILGFVFARRAERVIEAQPDRYRGLVEVRWARRLAWLGVVITMVSVIAVGFAWWGMNG